MNNNASSFPAYNITIHYWQDSLFTAHLWKDKVNLTLVSLLTPKWTGLVQLIGLNTFLEN